MSDEYNTPDSGTDNVNPQAPDTAEDWDYYDPDEDQDTEESPEVAATEDGTEEEAPEAQVSEEEPEASAAPEARVELANGEKVTVAELVKGYQRQADYTRKSQEIANSRRAIEADAKRIEGITEAFINHLSSLIPAPPSEALALQNPGAYVAQKAQYDAAIAQVQKLVEIGQQPKQISADISAEERNSVIARENNALAERFPETATKEGRTRFFEAVSVAAAELGFSADELSGVLDHRLFSLAHYAKIGMDALKARDKAKAKVAQVPQVSPVKPGKPGNPARNADAMRKLARSGSIHDAMKVDWE